MSTKSRSLQEDIYLTLSGFYQQQNEGHVYKSTNGGSNWLNISGNLPNIPVNDLIIWKANCSSQNLTIGTDIGVFNSTNDGNTWQELAGNLPNCPVMDVDFDEEYNVIRVATFGRSAWEVRVGPVFVSQTFESSEETIEFYDDVTICSGGKLKLHPGQEIKMPQGKKIIVESGGEIELSSGSVSFNQFSGAWDGIVLKDNAIWDVNSCTIYNSPTPISILGTEDLFYNTMSIHDAAFSNCGSVSIENRNNVNIENCEMKYQCPISFNPTPEICGLTVTGSDNITISENFIHTINGFSGNCLMNSTAIYVNYGSNIAITNNQIININNGIIVSNASPFIYKNNITTTNSLEANVGIGMDNSYASVLKSNEIYNMYKGVALLASSPVMLENIIETNVTGSFGMYAEFYSSPRMRPNNNQEEVVWDAGYNQIRNNANTAMYLYVECAPSMDYGCNIIDGYRMYMQATMQWPWIDPPTIYYIRGNTWENFDYNKFQIDVPIEYEPLDCQYGDINAGGEKENLINENINKLTPEPPQPFIVNYGNGIYDTLNTTVSSITLPEDQLLYSQGFKQELLGNFNNAIAIYKNLIDNYRDSITTLNSLSRLMQCMDRIHADTISYLNLRAYYNNLIVENPSDTNLIKIAGELATKCLVRIGNYMDAILEYEYIVGNSSDSLLILNAELNIIETYMIMQSNSMNRMYTGSYANLKPFDTKDGFKKINDRLYKRSNEEINKSIPNTFKLLQNYPNPFNPVTTIKYSVPKSINVNLKVYDILGRVVKTLVNDYKSPGNYSVSFDGSSLASGVYFYRIEAGDFVDSKKMILVK